MTKLGAEITCTNKGLKIRFLTQIDDIVLGVCVNGMVLFVD